MVSNVFWCHLPNVATYDLQPEMNSTELTNKLVGAIHSGNFDVIDRNYPNGDMVGHTGILSAAIKAVEAVDHCIGRVVEALQQVGGECLITADHGNAEQMHGSGIWSGTHSPHQRSCATDLCRPQCCSDARWYFK